MKKLLLLLFVTTFAFSQERINRNKISFISKSDTIKQAIGWSYDETFGEWVSFQNVICNNKKYKEENSLILSEFLTSHQKQNFSNMHFATVSLDSVLYYILIFEKITGGYEYPSIKRGWSINKETIGYIFSEKEYNKIFSLEDGITELKAESLVSSGWNTKFNEIDFLDKIQTVIRKENTSRWYYSTFPIKKITIEGKNLVRFYTPFNVNVINKYDFEKEYFEVPLKTFEKLLLNHS